VRWGFFYKQLFVLQYFTQPKELLKESLNHPRSKKKEAELSVFQVSKKLYL